MAQYPRSAATSEGYGNQSVSRGPSSATSAGFAGLGAATGGGFHPEAVEAIPVPHPTGAAAAAGIGAGAMGAGAMGAKQREAYQEAQRFRVTNEGQPGPNGSSEPTSPVTVHHDGGAYPPVEEEETYGREVPPT